MSNKNSNNLATTSPLNAKEMEQPAIVIRSVCVIGMFWKKSLSM